MEGDDDSVMEEDDDSATPVTKKEFEKGVQNFATKVDLETAIDAFRAEMNAKFDEVLKIIKSQQSGVTLDGTLVPGPRDGVVDGDGDVMFLHRITAAVKRHKGAVICLVMLPTRKKKLWKYE